MEKYYLNCFIALLIIICGAITSIEIKALTSIAACVYVPISFIILLYNVNEKTFWHKIAFSISLICLNELMIRHLADVARQSDGNPWVTVFFLFTVFLSGATILTITSLKQYQIHNYLKKIDGVSLILFSIASIYSSYFLFFLF